MIKNKKSLLPLKHKAKWLTGIIFLILHLPGKASHSNPGKYDSADFCCCCFQAVEYYVSVWVM